MEAMAVVTVAHSIISHGAVVGMLLLLKLVGEVDSQVRAGSVVRGTAQSHIAICIENHIRLSSNHQQVHSDVKFASSK